MIGWLVAVGLAVVVGIAFAAPWWTYVIIALVAVIVLLLVVLYRIGEAMWPL